MDDRCQLHGASLRLSLRLLQGRGPIIAPLQGPSRDLGKLVDNLSKEIATAVVQRADNLVAKDTNRVRDVFMREHADLLDAAFWQSHKERIQAGHVFDVFPYEPTKRFTQQRHNGPSSI